MSSAPLTPGLRDSILALAGERPAILPPVQEDWHVPRQPNGKISNADDLYGRYEHTDVTDEVCFIVTERALPKCDIRNATAFSCNYGQHIATCGVVENTNKEFPIKEKRRPPTPLHSMFSPGCLYQLCCYCTGGAVLSALVCAATCGNCCKPSRAAAAKRYKTESGFMSSKYGAHGYKTAKEKSVCESLFGSCFY